MHLKILIGVLTLGLATASPKAEPKPVAKSSAQFYASGPGGQIFLPASSNFGQQYAAQPIHGYAIQPIHGYAAHAVQGYPSSTVYNVGYAPSTYGYSAESSAGIPLNPKALAGNYYQQSQIASVPSAYSSAPAVSSGQSVNYYGAARLWPKSLVSPGGSPSPPASPVQVYYTSSTPSPIAYQSTPYYGQHSHVAVTTPSPIQTVQPQLIPVPVKVGSRNSFSPEITNYNTPHNIQVPVSTPASFVTKYSQSTPAPFVKSYHQPAGYSFAAYQQQPAGGSYVGQHQQPTAAPYVINYQQQATPASYQVGYQQQSKAGPHHVSYQQATPIVYHPGHQSQVKPAQYQVSYQQSSPAPYQVAYQQSTPTPYQVRYQQSTPVPYQVSYQQSSPAPYQVSYQQSTPAPYQFSYQQSTPAPPAVRYTTASPYTYQQSTVGQYQQPAVSYSGGQYSGSQYSKASPFVANYQRIPVPVGYQQTQVQVQPPKPTLTHVVSSTPSSVAEHSSVTIQPIPTVATPVRTVSITENPFVPLPTPTARTAVIRSEYNYGAVSPQYNHIPSTSGAHQYSLASHHGAHHVPAEPSNAYLPSTAASHVSYSGTGTSYNY